MAVEPRVKNITPATDWFCLYGGPQGRTIIVPVAAWAYCEEGCVVGLIDGFSRKLAFPPADNIVAYRHLSQLSPTELSKVQAKDFDPNDTIECMPQ